MLLIVAFATAGRRTQVVNPVTVLAMPQDVAAMSWIRAETRPDSVFLINEGFWQGNIYVGTDAGYWIPNLTGRRTTMPIVFYTQGSPQYVEQVNSLARVIESGPDPADPAFLHDLQARGVTHVYIGAKGGPLPLPKFEQNGIMPKCTRKGGYIFSRYVIDLSSPLLLTQRRAFASLQLPISHAYNILSLYSFFSIV